MRNEQSAVGENSLKELLKEGGHGKPLCFHAAAKPRPEWGKEPALWRMKGRV